MTIGSDSWSNCDCGSKVTSGEVGEKVRNRLLYTDLPLCTSPELECRDGNSEWSRLGKLLQGSEFVGVKVGRERLPKHRITIGI